MTHYRQRLLCRNGTSNLPPPACNAPDSRIRIIAIVWIFQLCDISAAVRRSSTPRLPSCICHDIVIEPADDGPSRHHLDRDKDARMAGKMLSVEPTIDP